MEYHWALKSSHICHKMNEPEEYYAKWDKLATEGKVTVWYHLFMG